MSREKNKENYSQNKAWELFKENINFKNIILPVFYIFNAISVSSDISTSVIWLGLSSKLGFIASAFVIFGWILLYLSSHNDKSCENKNDYKISKTSIQNFISENIDVKYLHLSQPNKELLNIEADHFQFIYALTIFHYFKKSFSEKLYSAIARKEKFINLKKTLKEKFDKLASKLKNIVTTKFIEVLDFEYAKEFTKENKLKFKKCIEDEISRFIFDLKTSINNGKNNIKSFHDIIKLLDDFSITKRDKIIEAINNDEAIEDFFKNKNQNLISLKKEDKKTTLKLLLKIEHTYTLETQRKASSFIRLFSYLNAFCSGITMLAGGFYKVKANYLYLSMFTLAGISCSYMLTSPKIYNIITSIFGHIENYVRSKYKKNKNTSFIFLLSIFMSSITALSSATFTYYILSKNINLLPSYFVTYLGNYLTYTIAFITFCGAFCLYFDSIFTIISHNKKDIYSPEDSLFETFTILKNYVCSLKINSELFLRILAISAMTYLAYNFFMISTNLVNLTSIIISIGSLIFFYPNKSKNISVAISMIVSSVITIAACHQFCTIFNLNLSPTIASVIIFFGFIQACSLSCTFYKGINKLISSIEKLFKYLKPKVEEINIDTKKIRENVVRSYSISSNYKRKISITPNRPSKVRKIENRSS